MRLSTLFGVFFIAAVSADPWFGKSSRTAQISDEVDEHSAMTGRGYAYHNTKMYASRLSTGARKLFNGAAAKASQIIARKTGSTKFGAAASKHGARAAELKAQGQEQALDQHQYKSAYHQHRADKIMEKMGNDNLGADRGVSADEDQGRASHAGVSGDNVNEVDAPTHDGASKAGTLKEIFE